MIITSFVRGLPEYVTSSFSKSNDNIINIKEGISIVIPFRSDAFMHRLKNINICINNILSYKILPIEIIISEESEEITKNLSLYNINNSNYVDIVHVHTKSSSRKFNKCAAVNVGVLKAKYERIIMNDADILFPVNYLEKVSNAFDNGYDSCFFGKEIYNIVVDKRKFNFYGKIRKDYFSGGSIAFSKKSFLDIGGMCEDFLGYGSEDCEFWTRITSLTKLLEQRDTVFLHLDHPRDSVLTENGKIYDEIINTPMDIRILKLKENLNNRIKELTFL